jgi:acyl carrier protein
MSEETNAPLSPLEQTLKRCRPEVIQAARDYQSGKDPKLLPTIVIGVLERFVEPERRGLLQAKDVSDLKLQADLGMDSLVMVEVVMTLEEVLGQQIPDTELRGLFTIGDTLAYVNAKATNAAPPTPPDRLIAEMIPMLLGSQTPLVSDVVLRAARAEGIFSGSPATPENLLKACEQLVFLWGSRKNEPQKVSPKVTQTTLALDAALPVQLRVDKENGWKAYYLQTGKPAVAFGVM